MVHHRSWHDGGSDYDLLLLLVLLRDYASDSAFALA